VLSVLGIGAGWPQGALSNAFFGDMLKAKGSAALIASGMVSRRSSLPEGYILETGNLDPRSAKESATDSPTTLAVAASTQALGRAGISPEQLGLIMGDCCTPYQVTPAEGQRIAEKFGLKIPSFDLYSTTGPIPAHLDVLASWNEERVPEYSLLVGTNTPLQRVDFMNGHEATIVGDAAGALVVSAKHRGKLALRETQFFHDAAHCEEIKFDAFKHATIPVKTESRIVDLALEMGRKAISDNNLDPSRIKFIGPEFSAQSANRISTGLGVTPQNHWSLVSGIGNSLSAAPIVVLSSRWDEIKKGDLIVCVQVGVGLSYGYALFEGAF